MAKEFFKNTGDAFKVLFQEAREAGKRFAQSDAAQKVAADVKGKMQELENSPLGAKSQDTVEKMGDEISQQMKKLYKVCPTCGRKMPSTDKYCASCGSPLLVEPIVWDKPENSVAEEIATDEDFQ